MVRELCSRSTLPGKYGPSSNPKGFSTTSPMRIMALLGDSLGDSLRTNRGKIEISQVFMIISYIRKTTGSIPIQVLYPTAVHILEVRQPFLPNLTAIFKINHPTRVPQKKSTSLTTSKHYHIQDARRHSKSVFQCNDPTIGSYNHYHLSPNGIPSGIQRWYGLVYIIHMAGNPRIRPRE